MSKDLCSEEVPRIFLNEIRSAQENMGSRDETQSNYIHHVFPQKILREGHIRASNLRSRYLLTKYFGFRKD